jgi:branched-chain amino acid transport system substrate-binding protein
MLSSPTRFSYCLTGPNIIDNVSIGPGIQFDAKGQNDKVKNGAVQNIGGKLVTLAPKSSNQSREAVVS